MDYGVIFAKNGVSIADNAFAYNAGKGMRDIFAYEIARNLGLDNATLDAGGPLNLMSETTFPASPGDIFPDGLMLGQLTSNQVARARSMPFAVSLPLAEQDQYPPKTPPPVLSIHLSDTNVVISWAEPISPCRPSPGSTHSGRTRRIHILRSSCPLKAGRICFG